MKELLLAKTNAGVMGTKASGVPKSAALRRIGIIIDEMSALCLGVAPIAASLFDMVRLGNGTAANRVYEPILG